MKSFPQIKRQTTRQAFTGVTVHLHHYKECGCAESQPQRSACKRGSGSSASFLPDMALRLVLRTQSRSGACAKLCQAFTLVEMLVVIAIIAILAALIVPMASNAAVRQRIARAQASMAQLETAIESYKAARGHYPPDAPNATNMATPTLFYELTGTVYESKQGAFPTRYLRINGSEGITGADVRPVFGVDGFVNSASVQSKNDRAQVQASDARDFYTGLKPDQYYEVSRAGYNFHLLGLPIEGRDTITSTTGKKFTAWRYNASNPTNNASTYDLWMDLVFKNKTNRICNWSDAPIVVK